MFVLSFAKCLYMQSLTSLNNTVSRQRLLLLFLESALCRGSGVQPTSHYLQVARAERSSPLKPSSSRLTLAPPLSLILLLGCGEGCLHLIQDFLWLLISNTLLETFSKWLAAGVPKTETSFLGLQLLHWKVA